MAEPAKRQILYIFILVASASNCTEQKDPTLRKLLQKGIFAPSWQFHSIDYKWQWHQSYDDEGSQVLSVFVREFEGSYVAAKNELVMMFGEESYIESRLRPLKSISQELDNDANKTVKDLYDIITWRITFPTVHQLLEAKKRFINSSRFGVAVVECYGVCPGAGKYAASGYRGITLIAEIDEKPLQVQLMTPYMVMWADWAYGVLLNKSLGSEKDVKTYGHQLTDYFYDLDRVRDKRPACPKILRDANLKSLTSKLTKRNKIFDALGGPPNACLFWNDVAVNKNPDIGARREVLGVLSQQKTKGSGNKPTVIDIDKILKPENLQEGKENSKDLKGNKRTLQWPLYYFY